MKSKCTTIRFLKTIVPLLLLFYAFKAVAAPIVFSDPNLKPFLLTASSSNFIAVNHSGNFVSIDLNSDGEIDDTTEAPLIKRLNIVYSSVTNLGGIENFTNLTELNCSHSPITSLSISALPNLTYLHFGYTNVTSFNCYGHPNIQNIQCFNGVLTNLNVSNCFNLVTLDCYQNDIATLNFNNCPLLTNVECSFNNLSSLYIVDVPALQVFQSYDSHLNSFVSFDAPSLIQLNIAKNNFTTIDVIFATTPNISTLYVNENALTSLDTSTLFNLTDLHCENNPNLINLNIKNGVNEAVNFSSCPNLNLICIDENQQTTIDAAILANGYTSCYASQYCTSFPAGSYYTITGENIFDSDTNGCDSADGLIANLKIDFSDGISTSSFITDPSGYYNYFVSDGTYTLTPVFEVPSYFNVSPTSGMASFPFDSNPSFQNFCISQNGIHNDLEVLIVPIDNAIPGFNANYKIVYKNKGNTIQSGTVTFDFNPLKLNYLSSTPVQTSLTTTQASWSFTNLLPFESKEILIALEIHSPMDTQPTNNGDVLAFSSSVTSTDVDSMSADNTFALDQFVVGAYDPNDITCLQGLTVGTDIVGDFVHYKIRFENTGTFYAQNVVVKTTIDTSKFDINSLVSLNGSHSFVTRILNGNTVEFVFNNIFLPFDDATNDGYLVFKIKTLSSLVIGDTFAANAAIFFDFNYPVITNTYQTTISAATTGGCINVSTGIDAAGNALSIGTIDPFWKIASSPNPPGTPAKVSTSFSASVWEPTPVATTNAEMINPSASCCSNLNGIYTFERDFVVPPGTTSLNCDFSIAYDDDIVSLELVQPDLTTIPLAVSPTTAYHLSLPITNSLASPMAGTWKIRATINFIDGIAFYLLSGCIKLNCQTLYVDADNDGYDNGSIIDCSGIVLTGYSLTTLGTDCDDTNASIGLSFAVPTNLQVGLLAQYTFNSGSTNDFSGNGHHLTNTTAIAATDRNGNPNCAFEFDNLPSSNNQFLSTSSTAFLNGLTEYSISGWYKAKDSSRGIADYEVLVGRDTGSITCPDKVGQWSLGLYDCRYAVFGRENSVWESFSSPCNETEVWHHVTATYNQVGNTIKLYKDGVLQNTTTGTASCGGPVTSADIGDLFLGKGFTGILDDVFIHNREITAAEVSQLYGLGSSCCQLSPCTVLVTPTFNALAPICTGDTLIALPTSSIEGITGTWTPALDNTITTTYTFTPAPGQCATTTTMTIVVNPTMQPNFYSYPPLCQNGFTPLLPTVSLEGIAGIWLPAFIDTSATGVYMYTFTPYSGQCASSTTMTILVNPNDIPTFNPVAPICAGDVLTALPLTSTNGITGTWSPALDNSTTTTYTFTPDAWQCATTATLTITVNPQSTNITTITNCSSYTWPVNGVTYTTSGIYTDIVGCTIGLLYLTIEIPTTWYIDADGDGAGNPAISIVDCDQPLGYVDNDNDCDDSNAAINPCAIENRTDGIDNNCNGFIDEIVTKLVNSQCGSNMTSFTQILVAQTVTVPSGSTICGYRFKVIKLVGGVPTTDVQIVTRSTNTFSFVSHLAHYAYNTTYSVQVSVCVNGVWQPYGADCCTVRCDKLSKVQASQCGTTLTSMGEFVYADIVNYIMPGSSNPWRFEITQVTPGAGFGTVQTFDTNLRRFTMNNFIATYGTTYSVRVAFLNTDGTWSSYGIACTITTPPFPTTQIQASQCGFTASNGTQLIWATGIPTTVDVPTHYRFRLSNAGILYSQTKDNTSKNFFLNQFIGLLPSTTYNVEVSMEIRGVYGPYGPMCTVTTPLVFRELPTSTETNSFDAVAYPNPAVDSFQIDVTTESKEPVLIQVYDLLGRLIENKQTTIDELYNLQLGNSYPSGVYQVIVKQENNLKTLRIIKR